MSGLAVPLREPTGAEDVLLAERRGDDPRLALALVERLAARRRTSTGAARGHRHRRADPAAAPWLATG